MTSAWCQHRRQEHRPTCTAPCRSFSRPHPQAFMEAPQGLRHDVALHGRLHQSQVTSHKSRVTVTSHKSQVTRHKSQVTSHKSQAASHVSLNGRLRAHPRGTRHKPPATSHESQVQRHKSQVAESQDTSHKLQAPSPRVTSHKSQVTSHKSQAASPSHKSQVTSRTLVAMSKALAKGTSGKSGPRHPGSTPNPMRQMLSKVYRNNGD